jgi:hypothetical protein
MLAFNMKSLNLAALEINQNDAASSKYGDDLREALGNMTVELLKHERVWLSVQRLFSQTQLVPPTPLVGHDKGKVTDRARISAP